MTDTDTSKAVPLKQQLDADLKTALLAGEKDKATVLRGLKSAILYVEVAKQSRDDGLPEDELQAILGKESKKRQESADLYRQGGNEEKAATELSEKAIIDAYLPQQLDESAIGDLVDEVLSGQGPLEKSMMGPTIAAVKAKAGGAADGATVARIVKERLGL